MTEEEFQELKILVNEIKEQQVKNGESLKTDIEPINKYIEQLQKDRSDLAEFEQSDAYKTQLAEEKAAKEAAEEALAKSYKHTEEIAASLKAMQKISEENQKNALTDTESTMTLLQDFNSNAQDMHKEAMNSDIFLTSTLVISVVLTIGLHGFLSRIFSR